MRDWFDFNNDGKLDAFEAKCKFDHINRSLDQIQKNSTGGYTMEEGCGTVLGLIVVFYILYLIYC